MPKHPKTSDPGLSKSIWRRPLLWAALAGACVEILLVVGTTIPLGIPGEWDWQRLPNESGASARLLLGAISVLPAAFVYLGICHFGASRIEAQGRRGEWTWLLLLSAGGFAWLWFLIDASPDEVHRLGRGPIVHYYDAFSGYFLDAREPEDFGAALADYESQMAEGDVLHIGTHPPGLMIAHRGLLSVLHASPALTDFVLATRPESVLATQQQIIMAFPPPRGPRLTDADLAALWAATIIALLAAALTAIPLYLAARASTSRLAAWQVACFWPLVPALAIFIPKSDAILPLLGMTIVVSWWPMATRSLLRVVAAGALFWLGMLMTLATLPIGCLLLLLTVGDLVRCKADERREAINKTIRDVFLAGAIFAGLTVLLWWTTDVNLLNVWQWNYHNHGEFYSEYDRTYWKWLLVNPLELALAVGLPLIAATLASFRHLDWKSPPLLAVIVTFALLWISGKNSGEAARLWLFAMPWLLWISAELWSHERNHAVWIGIVIIQMATTFIVASHVSGFEFQRFL